MNPLFTAANYRPNPGVHDESRQANGQPAAAWQYLIDSLGSLGNESLLERQKKALRILRDDGASYQIYNNSRPDSAWPLDLIPWLIESTEWNDIETGLQERAELYNLIFADLYGKRELISRGIIPPELVFGHNAFLRACDGIKLPGEHQLIIHAVDMMRAPNGKMRVLADRTQSPSGAGYALENRTVMSRVLPSLFRESHVHRLASFFQGLRQKLIDLAPATGQPEIAVLTPGAYNETYFEHAYLAHYLGFKLVQSSDLSVKNGIVWMKSLSGPTRVNVLLRRVDDYFCDQVELKGDSQLGVPGLLQAVRAGNVVVANPLGSGILENPALLRYLPEISQHFLGRKLRLATVDTWWCGENEDLQYVLENIDRLVVKKVFRAPQITSKIVSEMDLVARKQLLEAIKQDPGSYVAQEKLVPSHMPIFDGARLAGRPVLLRTYAVASDTSYRIMPGGLTRAGIEQNTPMISSQLGALSKDTWIVASEPEKQDTPWQQEDFSASTVVNEVLPSRVVENLYWMGRYAERSENILRLMRNVFLQLSGSHTLHNLQRNQLLQSVTHFTTTYPGFIGEPGRMDSPQKELLAVILDRSKVGSVSHCIQSMISCADESRDLLSNEGQRIINDIKEQVKELQRILPRDFLSAPEEAFNTLISSMLALSGVVQESMLRGTAWQFFDTGKRLERASQVAALLQGLLVAPEKTVDENPIIETLLMTFEVLLSYRRHNPGEMNIRNALKFLLQDSQNPRSLLFQRNQLQVNLAKLPSDTMGNSTQAEALKSLESISLVSLADIATLAAIDQQSGRREALEQLLSRSRKLTTEISEMLGARYFVPTQGPSQLLTQNWSLD
ncbi:MAG: circularly permuted type 2 ATP-grasp protein [Pseudomonadales bacterium]